MWNDDLGEKCLNYMKAHGADKCQYNLMESEKTELNFSDNGMGLFRTTDHNELTLKAIKDGRMAQISLTDLNSEESVKEAVINLMDMCRSSEPDINNDIAEYQMHEEFTAGLLEPDKDRIYSSVSRLLEECKEKYQYIKLYESFIYFEKVTEEYGNSNDVKFRSTVGQYHVNIGYAAEENGKSSSFNGIDMNVKELPEDLLNLGNMRYEFEHAYDQLNALPVEGKFKGKVIITPDCLLNLIYTYNDIFLKDMPIITGSSILKGKIDKKVADSSLTISSRPQGDDICSKVFFTEDGYKAKNIDYIDKGVLKSYLLTLYGAKKTGYIFNPTSERISIASGDKPLSDIIKETDKGIILSRFSGGQPSSNGDFSGVAKNSYYIENGRIKYPIIETMVSGNLYDMFNSIVNISEESLNFGFAKAPWIQADGIIISGKEK